MSTSRQPILFGTDGVRGIAGRELGFDLVLELALSIGTYFKAGRLIVGSDARTSSGLLLSIAIAGLNGSGCSVRNVGLAPTPAIQFLCREWQMDGAVIVTASHNPPEYNGIKVADEDGIELTPESEIEIEQIYFEKHWKPALRDNIGSSVKPQHGIQTYREALRKHVDIAALREASLKVVVDPANSVGALVTPQILREVGCKVLTINGDLDGSFPSRLPEPAPENLSTLCNTVKASRVDIGVAHDGDSDRAIFVDEKGVAHSGDKSFALIIKHYLALQNQRTVVTPVSSSSIIPELVESIGGRVEWTRVGSRHVSRIMKKLGSILGGEDNGGVIYAPHLYVRDGAMTALLMCQILARTRTPLSKLMSELPQFYSEKRKVDCPDIFKAKVLARIAKNVEGLRVDALDGIKIWFHNSSWVLVRPSGTEPIFRVTAESKDERIAKQLCSKYTGRVEEIIREVKNERLD